MFERRSTKARIVYCNKIRVIIEEVICEAGGGEKDDNSKNQMFELSYKGYFQSCLSLVCQIQLRLSHLGRFGPWSIVVELPQRHQNCYMQGEQASRHHAF